MYCLFCCVDIRKSLPITTTATTSVHYIIYIQTRITPPVDKHSPSVRVFCHTLFGCAASVRSVGDLVLSDFLRVFFPQRKSQSKAKVSLTTLFARHLCNPRRPASLLIRFPSRVSKTRLLGVNILCVSSFLRILFYLLCYVPDEFPDLRSSPDTSLTFHDVVSAPFFLFCPRHRVSHL